jgi:hypothetical protein
MQKMKESDLQEIIMNVSRPQIKKHNLQSVMVSSLPLQAAWLAAAQIAKLRGYKLSAKLVECSVLNNNYSETNGMFAKAIKKTRLWKTMKNRNNGSVAFTKAINADLFYSLHRCNYHTQSKKIIVTDLYDFKLENGSVINKTFNDRWTNYIDLSEKNFFMFGWNSKEGARWWLDMLTQNNIITVRKRKLVRKFQTAGLLDKMAEVGISWEEIDAAMSNEEF